ncbi:hypothetical protein GDO78_001760 [Eleutherodactylus coqui]|uniref:Uncharacterized protein n=1 Tax=Eleutherodactylus coqui TaxID=57060 RepID=A0A8J6KJF7_ELECQ|nr:hypothetical protein GDO78_001760 [Eleutherodactylus coqui]
MCNNLSSLVPTRHGNHFLATDKSWVPQHGIGKGRPCRRLASVTVKSERCSRIHTFYEQASDASYILYSNTGHRVCDKCITFAVIKHGLQH